MGLRCSIRCQSCQKEIIIREGGFLKKTNRKINCVRCGYENAVIFKKNGKVKIQ